MFLLLLLFLFSLTSCSYKELSKYGSVEVSQADTKVYLDITSFNTGDVISFEFIMDLFFADYYEQDRYIFQIGQVSASSYADYDCWKNLPNVTNRNLTKDSGFTGDDYIFTWDEIKQEGKNYIFIICPEPYNDFFEFWGETIKIKNLGGNGTSTSGAVIAIIISVIFIVIIIIIIIVVCCVKKRRYHNISQASLYNVQIQQQYQQPIPLQQQQVIIQPNVIAQPYPYQQVVYQDPNALQQPNVVQPIIQPQINNGQPGSIQQAYPAIDPNQEGQAPAPLQMKQNKNYSSSKMGTFSKPEFDKGYSSGNPQSNEFQRLN